VVWIILVNSLAEATAVANNAKTRLPVAVLSNLLPLYGRIQFQSCAVVPAGVLDPCASALYNYGSPLSRLRDAFQLIANPIKNGVDQGITIMQGSKITCLGTLAK
jgi:hypothetical protein